jgi:hypothetical protein
MLDKIISGGQTGADQAGLLAARVFGVPTGGRVPFGFVTEGGPRPEFAHLYGLSELPAEEPLKWYEQNVRDSDATLWFGKTSTPGAQETVRASRRFGKPCMPVYPAASFEPSHIGAWITENEIRTLNVAGNHESESPGIGVRVEQFLGQVLQQLGHERA